VNPNSTEFSLEQPKNPVLLISGFKSTIFVNRMTENIMIEIGKSAPGFNLPDQNGVNQKLGDLSGKWLLLFFYPKDDTPG
jgi:peroxiredoxin Q/BCP|tara:strand:- start:592 stop:831 length:240 start_codon:yes stop_codon:yes gene_type:complete